MNRRCGPLPPGKKHWGRVRLNHQARQVAVFVTATLADEQGRVFGTGSDELPPIVVENETIYRQELEAALSQLETVPE